MAIVADFDSCPQWNDEVKAVYALARHDAGRPGPGLVAVLDDELTDQRCSGSHSAAKKSPSNLLAIAPCFPTKEVRINRGGFSFRYRLRQSRVGRATTMDSLRRW